MSELTHLDAQGRARMVDVADKPVSRRVCVARGAVHMAPETLARIAHGTIAKGDVHVRLFDAHWVGGELRCSGLAHHMQDLRNAEDRFL